MSWVEHTIWWHVYPLGFTGAPVRPESADERVLTHRLRHLNNWQDHLVGLGANGWLLGPIFGSSTHGYDTVDFFRLDTRLGDDDDFAKFVAESKRRGVRIVLDGVFNHVGSRHPLYQAALRGPDAPENAYFRIDWSSGRASAADFEGHGDLVALNHASPAVEDLVVEVMLHWLRRGIDGWRLDAAYAVPADFWARVLPRVRAEFPDAWFLGEMIHGDFAGYARESSIDSVTQYWLWKATWSALKDENFFELDHSLGLHNGLLDTFVPQTFVGNHDVTRIASQVGEAKALLAAVVLMTVGGIPSVYYGDEENWLGDKFEGWGGDDPVRPMFPGEPPQLPYTGEHARRIYTELIGIRRRHSWLVRARTEKVELTNTRYVYDVIGEGRLRVELSVEPTISAVTSEGGNELWRYDGGPVKPA